jgi:hypothetical protein
MTETKTFHYQFDFRTVIFHHIFFVSYRTAMILICMALVAPQVRVQDLDRFRLGLVFLVILSLPDISEGVKILNEAWEVLKED